jgi:hypothetical protein
MSGIFVVLIIWAVISLPIGYAFAKLEQKVNGLPAPRAKSAMLFSFFLGPLGWIWLAARSGIMYASQIREGVTRGPQGRNQIQP